MAEVSFMSQTVGGRNSASIRPENPPVASLEVPTTLQRIGYWLTNPWKNHILPETWLRSLLSRSKSPLLSEAAVRPGGWRSMQIIYRNAQPVDWLDRQALRDNPVSMAARNRRCLVIQKLTELLQANAQRRSCGDVARDAKINVLGIGAGPGQHVQNAIVEAGLTAQDVASYLIDRDSDAFEFGEELANCLGIQECVEFHQGDATHIQQVLPGVRMDIVKLIGLIEYLTDTQLVDLLGSLRSVMRPGATLVTHAFVDVYNGGPCLRRVFNLKHNYRTADHLSALLTRAKFVVTDSLPEPTGTYPILIAVPDENAANSNQ